jgi:hypothetical protein
MRLGHLGTTDDLADLFQIPAVKRDKIAEELGVAGIYVSRPVPGDDPTHLSNLNLTVASARPGYAIHANQANRDRALTEPQAETKPHY